MKLLKHSLYVSSIALASLLLTPVIATASLPSGMYLGLFGGGGNISNTSFNQTGTSFIASGPLNVNALGASNNHAAGIVGGQLGYNTPWILKSNSSHWSLTPAAELEGYYLGTTLSGQLHNSTTRIPGHTFIDTLPMNTGVFLANIIVHLDTTDSKISPYVGAGLGAAAISITSANSSQITPAEPTINHFNSRTHATSTAFATQLKAGLNLNMTTNWQLFAEYRLLHLASTNYTFGSTQYPTHAVTTNWNIHLGDMNYSMGVMGLAYTFA